MNSPAMSLHVPAPATLIQTIELNGEHQVDVLRLDLIHPVISGNKWLKLVGYLEDFSDNFKGIASTGGAWSNHLHALAAWCYFNNVPCRLYVASKPGVHSLMLQDCVSWNADIRFLNSWSDEDATAIDATKDGFFFITRGGEGPSGRKGISEFFGNDYFTRYSHISCAVGTATMAMGIAAAMPTTKVYGLVPGLGSKSFDDLANSCSAFKNIELLNQQKPRFGKTNEATCNWMNTFYNSYKIPLDIIYTGRLFQYFVDKILPQLQPGEKHLLVHSGGLQGNRSCPPGMLKF